MGREVSRPRRICPGMAHPGGRARSGAGVAAPAAVAGTLLALALFSAPAAGVSAAGAGAAQSATYGTIDGETIPTPLLLPPGLQPRFLAEPVHTLRLAAGLVADGLIWTVTTGFPATLEGFEADGRVVVARALPGAYGANALAKGPDGSIWIGTNPRGIVDRFDPADGALERVTTLPGVNTVWSMVDDPADGLVWASTYPDAIWTIDPADGRATRLGPLAGVTGARVLGLADGAVWAGTYPTLAAFRLPADGVGANVLPPALSGSGQVLAIGSWSGGPAVLANTGNLAWLSSAGSLVGVLSDVQTLPMSFAGRTVVLRDGAVVVVNLADHGHVVGPTIARLPSPLAVAAAGVSGGRLEVLSSAGSVYTVSPGGAVESATPPLRAAAGTIQTLAETPWGLFGSAYLGGEVFQATPAGQIAALPGLDQVDSIVACAGALYLGVYPSARLYRYVPGQPWQPPLNPALIGSPGSPNDRVPGIACLDDTAYIGTVPGNGHLGGVLYTSSGHTVVPSVAGQTPISLATWRGELVGSLSDENALGVTGPKLPDHLFAYAPASGTWRTQALPGTASFAGVIGTSDGVLAASPDQIARWDPATGRLVVRTFRTGSGGDTGWGMGTHMFVADGRLYLVDDGWLYLVDPATLGTTALFYGVEQAAVVGPDVDFSFYDGRWLLQIAASRLTAAASTWPHQFWYIWRHDGHVWPEPGRS